MLGSLYSTVATISLQIVIANCQTKWTIEIKLAKCRREDCFGTIERKEILVSEEKQIIKGVHSVSIFSE